MDDSIDEMSSLIVRCNQITKDMAPVQLLASEMYVRLDVSWLFTMCFRKTAKKTLEGLENAFNQKP